LRCAFVKWQNERERRWAKREGERGIKRERGTHN